MPPVRYKISTFKDIGVGKVAVKCEFSTSEDIGVGIILRDSHRPHTFQSKSPKATGRPHIRRIPHIDS